LTKKSDTKQNLVRKINIATEHLHEYSNKGKKLPFEYSLEIYETLNELRVFVNESEMKEPKSEFWDKGK